MLNTMPPFQVFLSYGRPDTQVVHTFYRTLVASSITAWMDVENIRGGEHWRFAIKAAIRRSQLVLVFLSKNVITREGYLQEEILEALEVSRRKPPGALFLIPVRLDDCPIHPRLEQYQCVSLFAEHGRQRLLRQIDECHKAYLESLSVKRSAAR